MDLLLLPFDDSTIGVTAIPIISATSLNPQPQRSHPLPTATNQVRGDEDLDVFHH